MTAAWSDAVPAHMRESDQWVGHDAAKRPCILGTGRSAKSNDPKTWGSFEAAQEYHQLHAADGGGVGYVFTPDDGIVFLDFDKCLDESGVLKEWAEPLVAPFIGRTYIEISPSGRGLHVFAYGCAIVDGKGRQVRLGDGQVEIYTRGRYSTITGRVFQGSATLAEAQDEIDALLAALPERKVEKASVSSAPDPVLDLLRVRGLHKREIELGKHDITCPWVAEHTEAIDGGTAYFAPSEKNAGIGGFKCQHAHCDGRNIGDLLGWLGVERKNPAAAVVFPEGLDSGSALLDTEYPPLTFAVAPYLPKAELVEIHGPHAMFKSTLMHYACLSVATGEPWGGAPVTQGRSVFISLEDKSATLARRTRAWLLGDPLHEKMHGAKRLPSKLERAIRENFRSLGREKSGPLALTSTDYGQTAVRWEVVDWIVKQCEGGDLVVLETAARLHPGAETNEGLAVLGNALEMIATRTGACVVLVRHTGKEQARSGALDSYGGRGGGALADAARSVLVVGRDEDKPLAPVKIVQKKATHSACGPDLMWRPVPTSAGVFLRAMTGEEQVNDLARRLLEKIREAGMEGTTKRELTRSLANKRKGGVTSARIDEALRALVADGRVIAEIPRGKRGTPAPTYWAPGFEPKIEEPAVPDVPAKRKGKAA